MLTLFPRRALPQTNALKEQPRNAIEPKFRQLPGDNGDQYESTIVRQTKDVVQLHETVRKEAREHGVPMKGEGAGADSVDIYETVASGSFTAPHVQHAAVRQHQELATRDAKALAEYRNRWTRSGPLITKLRARLLERGTSGIKGVQRFFRAIDDDGNKKISYEEWVDGLKEYNVRGFSDEEALKMAKMFDTDKDGTINFDELLMALRPPMNEKRLAVIADAWNIIDENGDGVLTVADVVGKYDVSRHPKFVSGEKTKEELLAKFLEKYDTPGDGDALIEQSEFVNYYAGVSASMDNDDHFVQLLRAAWKMGEHGKEVKKGVAW